MVFLRLPRIHSFGGFAGAALAHAYISTGFVGFAEVVEMEKITKTILFIFLAPLIGMMVSMYIALVTLMRNTWLRILVILITAACTWVLFDYLEQSKLAENVKKYYKIEQLTKEVETKPELQVKLDSAIYAVAVTKPLLADFNTGKIRQIATEVKQTIDPGLDEKKFAEKVKESRQFYNY